jgi:hypothetical protein
MIFQIKRRVTRSFSQSGTGNKKFLLSLKVLFSLIALIAAFPVSAGDVADLIREIKAKYACHSSPVPVISRVVYQKEPVGAWQKFEITFKLDANYGNPFDPDDINVEGHFIYPDGRTVTIPAFFYDRYEPVNDKTTNTYLSTCYEKMNESGWKIRFSSGMTGDYKFYITAKDSKGQVDKTGFMPFEITTSGSKGYVRVSKANPRYFENSADGSLFYGSGTNIHAVIGTREEDPAKQNFEYYFNKAKGNCSSTRIWICHWRWLEWAPDPEQPKSHTYGGVNFYNQALSSNLDRIFSMAEDINLRIQLTLEDNEEHDQGAKYNCWGFNPYNIKNGGPVATSEAYWTSKEVRQLYKKKLRYIAARWGYSTSMWSLNQWNDMSNPTPEQVDYSKELHDYVHTVFDGWRPIIFGSNFGHGVDRYMDYAMFGKSKETSKPGVTQECYYTANIGWFNSALQDQLWEGLMLGNAIRMVWPHWMVDEANSWPVFKSILNFVSDVPLNKKKWNPARVNMVSSGPVEGKIFQKVIEVKGYGDIPSSGIKAPQNLFYVSNNESSQFLEGFAAGSGWQGHMLYGEKNGPLRNPPTFVINAPEGGSMLIRVKVVAAGTHRLVSEINGKSGPCREWNYRENTEVKGKSKEEEYLSIPLNKGENRISIDCEGPDFIRIGWIYFILDTADPNGSLAVSGLVSENQDDAIVYVKNQTYTELYYTILGKEPAALSPVLLEVPGLKDGKYNVVFYDPSTGNYAGTLLIESANGRLMCPVKKIEKDVAIKIREVSLPVETVLPEEFPAGWYKAQQHTHSTWSDGRQTITQNVEYAVDHEFNILVSTDHSTMVTREEIPPMEEEILKNNRNGFLSVYGDEVSYNARTDPPNEGHLLAIGIREFIDHTHKQPQEVFQECRAQGGLAFIAHPYNAPYNFSDWDASGYTGIEIWNGADHNVFCNEGGVWTPTRNSVKKWDELNRFGRRLVGIANADAHNDHQIDDLWTVIWLPRFTKEDYMNSLAKGHAYGTNGPSIQFAVDEKIMGSDLEVPTGGENVSISISGNSNSKHNITRVTLIRNGHIEQQWLNTNSTVFSAKVVKFAKPGDFFRATVECMVTVQTNGSTKNGTEYGAFSNPVWIIGEMDKKADDPAL